MRKASAEIAETPKSAAVSDNKERREFLSGFWRMSQEEWQRLLQDKERVQCENSEHPEYCFEYYPQIARSWITSRGSGVNIEAQALGRSFLDERELTRIQQENELLINYVKSLFPAFRREMQAYSNAYTLDLLDRDGVILYNDSTLPRSFPAIVPAVGTIWHDRIVGTNVCSLAYQTQRTVLLPGILHYSDIFEDLITAAAPVRSSSGQITALLAYVQKASVHPWEEGYQAIGLQSLSIVVAMATALENFIQHNEARPKGPKGQPLKGERAGGTAVHRFGDLIGVSQEWRKAVNLGQRYASFDENIMLTGESGTGKELLAQAIHNERCPNGPFMVVNCAALPRSLIESELFGYEEGSFTGASRRGQPGKIELAHGGTLFLDEIGDMPLELQSVLLRVLENKQVMRLGGRRYQKVDFCLVAATNKNLEQMVESGQFREDLYFRLSVLHIALPPLRRRGRDSELLARHFIAKYSAKWGKAPLSLSPETCAQLASYDWPGNVRQLENAMVCALATEESDTIQPGSLPEKVRMNRGLPAGQAQDTASLQNPGWQCGDYSLASWEKAAIQAAMEASGSLIPLAADLLGIGKSTLYKKLREYDLK